MRIEGKKAVMFRVSNHLLRQWIVCGCATFISVALPAWAASLGQVQGQTDSGSSAKVNRIENTIADIKEGKFFLLDGIEAIAVTAPSGRADVIPLLEAQFGSNQDISEKDRIAGSLVRLGDKDDTYWSFLVAQAIPAAEDDAPFFLRVDEKGKMTKEPSPDFLKWAADHHLSANQAFEKEFTEEPGAILMLAFAQDARAIPILRRALASENFLIASEAAKGLADLGDKDSAPLIIEACSKAPADAATQIATSLVYFDSQAAKRAFDLYVPEPYASMARKGRSDGQTALGSIP